MIDGQEIVLIATGFKHRSENGKTGGDLLQTFILRADVAPIDAVAQGLDVSICGDCIHRRNEYGSRTCYVRLTHGPRGVYESFRLGNIPAFGTDDLDYIRDNKLGIRMGTYGDPAAVPFEVWQGLLQAAAYNTGYTHRSVTNPDVQKFMQYVMASCETQREVDIAHDNGFRAFHVQPQGTVTIDLPPGTIECRATAIGVQCDACKLCGSKGVKSGLDIVIPAHGINAATVEKKVERREIALQ